MRMNVDVEGFDRVGAMLRRAGPEGADRAADEIGDEATRLARKAATALRSRPGGGRYSRRGVDYRGKATRSGGEIRITGPTGRGAEFGMRRHVVFGRSVSASTMRRRVFPAWQATADAESGYVVGATLRQNRREIVDAALTGADAGMRRAASKSRVRTRGRR